MVPGSRCPEPSCELSSWRSGAGSSPGSGERAAMWSLVPVALSGSLPLAVCFGQGRGGLLPDPSKLSVFMEPHVRSARPCPQTIITCGGTTPATPPTHSLPPASPLPASAGSSESKGGVGLPNPHCPRWPHAWRQESHVRERGWWLWAARSGDALCRDSHSLPFSWPCTKPLFPQTGPGRDTVHCPVVETFARKGGSVRGTGS